MKKNWDNLYSQLDKNLTADLSMGQPVIVDDYSTASNCKTIFLITPLFIDNEKIFMLQAANIINIKKRLINVNYYMEYKSKNTLDILKSKNTAFIKALNSVN